MNMKSVKLKRQKKIEESEEVIMTPVDITPVTPSTAIIALKAMVMMVSNMAGQIVINMS